MRPVHHPRRQSCVVRRQTLSDETQETPCPRPPQAGTAWAVNDRHDQRTGGLHSLDSDVSAPTRQYPAIMAAEVTERSTGRPLQSRLHQALPLPSVPLASIFASSVRSPPVHQTCCLPQCAHRRFHDTARPWARAPTSVLTTRHQQQLPP
ncbi:hypothetical protein BD310DRAFT_491194 [Dichomitus squalens]|uniref:Uncharacterized protein n=1 Tax=Dichomitus squalens TaxID=114155 RepID=A0A4Q9PFC1_9APHY|nr:hypothetical protein BD310DRAFT_491194 [Dichomitus squalens]